MKRTTIELEARWDKIQNFRFILQLAAYADLIVLRCPASEALLQAFPDCAVRLADRLKTPEPFETIHDGSPYMACRFRGCEIRGPFFSREMLRRIPRGPKIKTLSFWGHPHPWRAAELAPWREHCRWRPRSEVNKAWDAPYFDELAQTEFAICATGQCPWLYRHEEAIVAFAIPANTPQQAAHGLPTCYHEVTLEPGRLPAYSPALAAENYQIMQTRMTCHWKPLFQSLGACA
jgi:hypothetical protein